MLVRQDARTGRVASQTWSPSSALVLDVVGDRRVVFDTRSPRQNLREMTLAPGGAAESHWLSRGESTDRQPVYSPDGERVAFSSNRGGGMNLWVVSTSTGRLITSRRCPKQLAKKSPKGASTAGRASPSQNMRKSISW